MPDSLPPLSWDALDAIDRGAPVVVAAARGPARSLALSRLGAPLATPGTPLLWVGSQHVQRPLAWLPVPERRLDARPLRPGLGDAAWPAVNPFELDPAYAAAWLGAVLGVAAGAAWSPFYTAVRRALAVDATRQTLNGAQRGVRDALYRLAAHLPSHEAALLALAGGRTHTLLDAAQDRTAFDPAVGGLTVVCGHPADLTTRGAEVLLLLLAACSSAVADPSRPSAIIVEDWLDLAPPGATAVAAGALLDVSRLTQTRVVLATACPERWVDSPITHAVLAQASVVVDPAAAPAIPACWDYAPIGRAQSYGQPSALVLDRLSARWIPHALPSPVADVPPWTDPRASLS